MGAVLAQGRRGSEVFDDKREVRGYIGQRCKRCS